MSYGDDAHRLSDGDPLPTAFALQGILTAAGARPEEHLREGIEAFLAGLAASLKERGCRLIGHIKGLLDAEEAGHLFFSMSSFGQPPRFKGTLAGGSGRMNLTLNVIVYGVGAGEIEPLVLEGLRRHLGEVSREEAKPGRDEG